MERDHALTQSDFMLQRHAEELALEIETILSANDYQALLLHRQALRDLPEHARWPDVDLPDCPIEVK